MNLVDSNYSEMDKRILLEEYQTLKEKILSYSPETPYYVYSLFNPNGQPIYFGKGKGGRIFAHIRSFLKGGNGMTKRLYRAISSVGVDPPIMHIVQGNMSQEDAFSLEKELIAQYRDSIANIMPGGGTFSKAALCSSSGRIGGVLLKSQKKGIFSESWDRSVQSKKNWKSGLLDHVDFVSIGKIAGAASVKSGKGIHSPDVGCEQRKMWAKSGAEGLAKSGNRSGVCSPEWRAANPERVTEIAKVNGSNKREQCANMASRPWWTDGLRNVKSEACPGAEFKRGMTRSKMKGVK